jgi:hypothetical protein
MPDHDTLYHRLFDHPNMVTQLLREFVAGPWLDELDLAGMERLNAKFHAETGDRREGDMIWRIPRRDGGDTYLLLLLEFQSTPYRWMALRMLVYASLLWQQLVNEKSLPPDGKLPPILPVVLYNGDRRWAAPLALHDLVGLRGDSPLWRWQPTMRYEVVDEGAFPEEDLARRDALVALLFRLESSPDPGQLVVLADAVLLWFRQHPGLEALRGVFATLLGAILAPLAPGVGPRKSCWRLGTCWQRGPRPGSGSGCKRASRRAGLKVSRKAVKRARRRSCYAYWSAASVRCLTGRGTASLRPAPRPWRSGVCAYWRPAAWRMS